jgi:hypothetical protein
MIMSGIYIKIMPYRNEDNAVDGIIVTFTEISKLRLQSLRKKRLQIG